MQIGTAVMLNGFGKITEIVADIEKWSMEKGIKDLKAIKGQALQNLKSFEEIKIEPIVSRIDHESCELDCNACMNACIYGAIQKNDNVMIFASDKCAGCGLCTFVCPSKKLRLDW